MKFSDVSDLSKEDVLSALGLSIKPSTSERVFGSLGLIGLGAVVGAGVALLLAPSSGQELRADLGDKIRRYTPDVAKGIGDRNGREATDRQTT
jgi:gas vesicle protein